MFHWGEHSCGDCKLRCTDCNAQICPKCMVQCPVGNRCRNCTKRFTSHVLQIDFWVILRGFGAAFIVGLLFSLLQGLCPMGGFFMLFFIYLFGSFVGNIIFKIIGRKLGPKVAVTVAIGVLAGSLCLYFAWQSLYGVTINRLITKNAIANSVANQSQSVIDSSNSQNKATTKLSQSSTLSIQNNVDRSNSPDALYALAALQASRGLAPSPISLSLIIFILGTIGPFLGWGTPIPGFMQR